jgi:hypothetical protein
MMLSTQAARMGSVHTTLRKIGCRASKNNRAFSLVESGRSWFPPSSSSSTTSTHVFLGRSRLVREQDYYASVGVMPSIIWNRNKSTAASAQRQDDFEEEKDDATTRVILEKHEVLYQQYHGSARGHAAAPATVTVGAAMVTSLPVGGAAASTQHLPDAAAMAWMVNLGRNNDNEWLTGPRGQEWFTGTHPLECPGMY